MFVWLRGNGEKYSFPEEGKDRMRAPKVYIVLALLAICALPAAGYAQTNAAQAGQDAANSQDASPKPANSGDSSAPDARPNSRNNPGNAMPLQSAPGNKTGVLTPTQRATPANPATADQNSPSTTAHGSQAPIPQNVLFELLFGNISTLNQVADHDDKAGNHIQAAAWRRYDQEAAGLNDAEGDILREIALDCARALKEQDAKIKASADKFRAQSTPGVRTPAPAELVQLFEYRKKIVSDHVESLQEALGDSSFNKLDSYVHAAFHAERIVPKPAIPSTTEKK